MRSPFALVICLATFLIPSLVHAADKPNIIVLFMDDGGYGDLGSYGHPTISTPHLDQMAQEGMRFTQFYSASPACSASRYSLLTGRLPVRSGFRWVLSPSSDRGIHPKEITIAEGLKSAGYATAAFGKWHLGRPDELLPLAHGFDEYLGFPYSNDMIPPKWVDIPLLEGNEIVELNPDQSKLTKLYTERTIQFIKKNKRGPFFCYLPYAMPHVPLYPGKAHQGQSRRGLYGDVIEEIDWSVGEILKTLKKQGLDKNTLVIFTSDNGPWIIKDEKGGSAGHLRDGKGSTWEGGVREPCIAWWPGEVPAGVVCREPASTMDILPTAFNLAGVMTTQDRSIDGRDITKVLKKGTRKHQRDPLFFYGSRELHAVRVGDWKLHIKTSSQTKIKHFNGKVPLLFNLEEDPSEEWDRAESNPEKVAELQKIIDDHLASLKEEVPYWGDYALKIER